MEYDAILVPGGGVRAGGELPAYVTARFDRALTLAGDSAWILAQSAGTPYKPPPLDARGRPILESAAGADYLRQLGFPADRIAVENGSYDTIGNAYYARVLHADPAGWRRLCVVTSEFHLPRTEAAYRWVFGLSPLHTAFELEFVATEDTGISGAALAERQAKECASLSGLRQLTKGICTLPDLHRWLFVEHDAYSAAGRPPLSGVPLDTY
jgi:hypothetical protein